MRRIRQTRHLVLVIGLGLAAVAGLLWWMNCRAAAVQASARSLVATTSPIEDSGIAVSWASTTPYSTVLDDESQTWPITEHHVTVTFSANSIGENSIAVFTFTPQTSPTVPPMSLSSYFYDLSGVFSGTDIRVSLKADYDIVLQYDPSELGDVEENTLRFYNFDVFWNRWEQQATSIDVDNNTVSCTTRQTGQFALAGYGYQVFLPIVVREY
jgi:hypothetical protein